MRLAALENVQEEGSVEAELQEVFVYMLAILANTKKKGGELRRRGGGEVKLTCHANGKDLTLTTVSRRKTIFKMVFHDGGLKGALMASAFENLLRAAMRVSAGAELGSRMGRDIMVFVPDRGVRFPPRLLRESHNSWRRIRRRNERKQFTDLEAFKTKEKKGREGESRENINQS